MILTTDQQKALKEFEYFLLDPAEKVFVLSGYSGTGKTTLVKEILAKIPKLLDLVELLDPNSTQYNLQLTATTNKAAENMQDVTGHPCSTIHSFLGLRVITDYQKGITKLVLKQGATPRQQYILFIDEASFIDSPLLDQIFKMTKDCKIVFVGDPAQLTAVKSGTAPVFNCGFKGAALTQVVRQLAGNPIVDLSTKFRNTVTSGEFFHFKPDGVAIQHMDRFNFNTAIANEFNRPDWKHDDSKVLGWTNKCAIGYNNHVNNLVGGTIEFKAGDYAVVNKFVTQGSLSLKTDQLVKITKISPDYEQLGLIGNDYELDNYCQFFAPKSLADKKALIKDCKANDKFRELEMIDTAWVDLRAAYACTINKSQGSTYNKVFIDLDDVRGCNSGEQIARMLYVGVSRAKTQVFFTGDLVKG